MIKNLGWIRIGFLAVFAVLTVATWTYQLVWVQPRQRCVAAGRWWSEQDRECGIPVSVSRFTGRPTPSELEPAKPPAAARP